MYDQDLKENAELGASIIKGFLKGEKHATDKIKYASNSITQYNKHLATKGAIDTIKFAVGRSISETNKDLKEFLTTSMPEYVPHKVLK